MAVNEELIAGVCQVYKNYYYLTPSSDRLYCKCGLQPAVHVHHSCVYNVRLVQKEHTLYTCLFINSHTSVIGMHVCKRVAWLVAAAVLAAIIGARLGMAISFGPVGAAVGAAVGVTLTVTVEVVMLMMVHVVQGMRLDYIHTHTVLFANL